MRWAKRLLPLALLLGCGAEDEGAAAEDHFAWLEQRATEVRELRFRAPVEWQLLSNNEYLEGVADSIAKIPEEEIDRYFETYGRMGFFDATVDIRAMLLERQKSVLAYYSYGKNRMTLIGDWEDDVAVHELVHALQDQHFDLTTYDDFATSDGFLARRAGTEGDADLARERFTLQQAGSELDEVEWSDRLMLELEQSHRVFETAKAPLYFEALRSFAYPYGFIYAAHLLMGVEAAAPVPVLAAPYDWQPIDSMVAERRLATSEQVIALDRQDDVVAIGLDQVPEHLARDLEGVDWDTLGAWYSYVMLYPARSSEGATDIAALRDAWDGDRVLFVRDRQAGQSGFVWASAWDDEAAALGVEQALQRLYEPDGAAAHLVAADGEPLLLWRESDRLVVVKNVEPALAEALAAAALAPVASEPVPRRAPSLAEWLGAGRTD